MAKESILKKKKKNALTEALCTKKECVWCEKTHSEIYFPLVPQLVSD